MTFLVTFVGCLCGLALMIAYACDVSTGFTSVLCQNYTLKYTYNYVDYAGNCNQRLTEAGILIACGTLMAIANTFNLLLIATKKSNNIALTPCPENASTSNPPPQPNTTVNLVSIHRRLRLRPQPTTHSTTLFNLFSTHNNSTNNTLPITPPPANSVSCNAGHNTNDPLPPTPAPITPSNLITSTNNPLSQSTLSTNLNASINNPQQQPRQPIPSINPNFETYLQSYLQATSNPATTPASTPSVTLDPTDDTAFALPRNLNTIANNPLSRPRPTSVNPKFQSYLQSYLQAISNPTTISAMPRTTTSVNLNTETNNSATTPSAPNIDLLPSTNDSTASVFDECSICFNEFDEEIRKPKRLPCNHTVCLLCLMELRQKGNVFSCPFCRYLFKQENLDHLPDNIITRQVELPSTDQPAAVNNNTDLYSASNETDEAGSMEVNWCLACEAVENVECISSGHFSIQVSFYIIPYLEAAMAST